MKLDPHQLSGVEFLRAAGGRAMLADDMGLGKTATVLSYLKQEKLPAIVVTTKSFLHGWCGEAAMWYPEAKVQLLSNAKEAPRADADLLVTTYDVLWRCKDLHDVGFSTIVFDESHKLANQDSKRSEAARTMAAAKRQVICMTGTPQPNGQTQQLWHQLLLIFPEFLSWRKFAERYCAAKRVWAPWKDGYVWDTTGSSNLDELREIMRPRFLRRTKELLNLPPMTVEWLPVPVNLKRETDEAWPAYAARLATAKAACSHQLVADLIEQGKKVLFFTSYRSVRDEFAGEAIRLTAEMSAAERAEAVRDFQASDAPVVFAATTQIAAEGITLTAADAAVFNDCPWSPGLLEQAQARAHRKGQTKPVHVYRMQSESPFDAAVRESLENKQEVTERLLQEKLGL